MNPKWKKLIKNLKDKGVLKTPNITKAFKEIDRADFVLEEYKNIAYLDQPLPILSGQTISQPYTVAFMLDLLRPQPGDKILDIGAGSGWQTALLAHIVSQKGGRGRVYALELIPEVSRFGKSNVTKYNFVKKGIVEWFCRDASKGLVEKSPFDKIIAAASLEKKPPLEWFDQLKSKGRLVCPIKHSIFLFLKKDDKIESYEYPGFSFVPFQFNS